MSLQDIRTISLHSLVATLRQGNKVKIQAARTRQARIGTSEIQEASLAINDTISAMAMARDSMEAGLRSDDNERREEPSSSTYPDQRGESEGYPRNLVIGFD